MSSMVVHAPVDELAFEQIEAAVKETVRGRQFLDEYAKRHRHADTMMVLEAIRALQGNLGVRSGSIHVDRLQGDILEMARVIARTEQEIRAIQPIGGPDMRLYTASDELDAVVGTTEQATSSILAAAEKMQECAWTMREKGHEEAECDLLDTCATEIYTACSFQDVTAQRIRKVVGTLSFLDQRIKSMLDVWGIDQSSAFAPESATEAGVTPSHRPSDIWMSDANQAEIDDTFDMFVPAAVSEPTMVGAEIMDDESMIIEAEPIKPAKASRTAAAAKATKTPDIATQAVAIEAAPGIEAPAAPAEPFFAVYDNMSLEERLRAFR